MKRALLSVSDKRGLDHFARELVERGWSLLSTGGTGQALREAGLDVTDVADVTGHPEMMDGRVKTLHPAVHAGILARRDHPDDLEALEEAGYGPIDLVAVNLYPFRETVARGSVAVPEAMEKVDIGGPTMIRAAAKSHADVWVVVDPSDYAELLDSLDGKGDAAALRRRLAVKVFRHVSGYDAAVADYLDRVDDVGTAPDRPAGKSREDDRLPATLELDLERVSSLRYGENPDQAAAFYGHDAVTGLAALEQHHGKELSYNNLLDLDGALLSLAPFAWVDRAAVSIVKHTTPCGLALGDDVAGAWGKALACDPLSAFGSVVAANRPVDEAAAALISQIFVECVVAPSFDEAALERLTAKKNVRLLTFADAEAPRIEGTSAGGTARDAGAFLAGYGQDGGGRVLRSVYGGLLAQSAPRPPFYGSGEEDWKVVTARGPEEDELADLRFAWAVAWAVKSNAIVLASDGATVGIGAGQMSRVDASRIAVRKAADQDLPLDGAVLASDAFFPFRDGVDAAAAAGVRAIVQPGGSIRDEEVVAAADEHGIAMVFTGRRLFRH